MKKALLALAVCAPLFFSSCAAMKAAYEKSIDDSFAASVPAKQGAYRRVLVEQVRCRGPLCTPELEAQLTSLISKSMMDACYTLIDGREYDRYADHYARKLSASGLTVTVRGPGGGYLELGALNPALKDVLVEEMDIDAVLSSTITIGAPDDVTKFRQAVIDLHLASARNGETGWRGRAEGNIMEDAQAIQQSSQLAKDLGAGINRNVSICALQNTPNRFDDINVADDQIKLRQKIFFELDSDALSVRSQPTLDRLAAFLNLHKEHKVIIEGHTDNVGAPAYNLELSTRRATSVKNYLVMKGVDGTRLEAVGKGESKPLVPNDTEANRARNRRVEFKLKK